MRGAAAILPPGRIQEAGRADPVGEQTEGEKPRKAFFFLDPYRWEFRLGGGEEGYDPRYDDEATVLPVIFSSVRDYRCDPGKRCPCPDENCVQHVANTWSGGCDPHEDGCRMIRNVTLEHFKSWKDYDAIHVSSHGTELCDDKGANCAAGIASGLIIFGTLREMVRRDPGIIAGNWRTEPGVELVGPLGRPLHHCSVPDPETAEERIEDGDVLPLFTRPGDGAPDTLDTLIEVVGVDPEEEDPAGYVLKANLKGRSPTDSAALRFATDQEGTYRA